MRDKPVVVITGAASGIGRATALLFAAEGARLHLVDINRDGLASAATECEQQGGRATAHVVDCTDAGAMEKLAEDVFAADGRVDVLHNNAGVCLAGSVGKLSLESWRWIMDINVWGVIHGVHAFVPRMIRQGGGGHIVNTASMAGLIGIPQVVPYCTTKFAVVGLSEALAAELAPHGIHVAAICPAMSATSLVGGSRLDFPEKWRSRLEWAMRHFGESPASVARRVRWTIRTGRSLEPTSGSMNWAVILKRISPEAYQIAASLLTRVLMRFGRYLP